MSVSTQLTIIVDARYVTAMGYGNIWNATVKQVVKGGLPDAKIQLSLFDNAGGAAYHGRFRGGHEEQGVKLTLTPVPDMPAALEGFVAGDGTIWQIVAVE